MRPFSRFGSAAFRQTARTPVRVQQTAVTSLSRASAKPSIGRQHAVSGARIRAFHSSTIRSGIMPESENPPPKESEASEKPTVPTDIQTSEYHARADEFLDELVRRLEAQQERRPDVEVEHSAGVLEIDIKNQGIFVLNKQPANKQIWLSSPISGPKRFDWVVTGESQTQKEGTGVGDWIYLRDGTTLTQLLRKEIGVEVGVDEAPL